jgi:type II secretory ATPase GspE/PulE/Tfp pilus assembly ATPase PilB-like protein
MNVESFLLSSTLNVILAQRLVRRLSDSKEKYRLGDDEIQTLGKYCDIKKIEKSLRSDKVIGANDNFKNIDFYRPKPSKTAPDGYKGRLGIYEVLRVTETIKELIQKGATSDEVQKQAISEGMRLMLEDGFCKAAKGFTSIEEVLRVIVE